MLNLPQDKNPYVNKKFFVVLPFSKANTVNSPTMLFVLCVEPVFESLNDSPYLFYLFLCELHTLLSFCWMLSMCLC